MPQISESCLFKCGSNDGFLVSKHPDSVRDCLVQATFPSLEGVRELSVAREDGLSRMINPVLDQKEKTETSSIFWHKICKKRYDRLQPLRKMRQSTPALDQRKCIVQESPDIDLSSEVHGGGYHTEDNSENQVTRKFSTLVQIPQLPSGFSPERMWRSKKGSLRKKGGGGSGSATSLPTHPAEHTVALPLSPPSIWRSLPEASSNKAFGQRGRKRKQGRPPGTGGRAGGSGEDDGRFPCQMCLQFRDTGPPCDERFPTCTFCELSGEACFYNSHPLQKIPENKKPEPVVRSQTEGNEAKSEAVDKQVRTPRPNGSQKKRVKIEEEDLSEILKAISDFEDKVVDPEGTVLLQTRGGVVRRGTRQRKTPENIYGVQRKKEAPSNTNTGKEERRGRKKKKQAESAAHDCDRCRIHRQNPCDRGMPECTSCVQAGVQCDYPPVDATPTQTPSKASSKTPAVEPTLPKSAPPRAKSTKLDDDSAAKSKTVKSKSKGRRGRPPAKKVAFELPLAKDLQDSTEMEPKRDTFTKEGKTDENWTESCDQSSLKAKLRKARTTALLAAAYGGPGLAGDDGVSDRERRIFRDHLWARTLQVCGSSSALADQAGPPAAHFHPCQHGLNGPPVCQICTMNCPCIQCVAHLDARIVSVRDAPDSVPTPAAEDQADTGAGPSKPQKGPAPSNRGEYSETLKKQVAEKHVAKGVPKKTLAREVGVDPSTVRRWVQQFGEEFQSASSGSLLKPGSATTQSPPLSPGREGPSASVAADATLKQLLATQKMAQTKLERAELELRTATENHELALMEAHEATKAVHKHYLFHNFSLVTI